MQKPQSGLYNAVWRWHFYAAVFVIPFLLVFAVTGSIYLFKPQIENWLYGDLYRISATGPKPLAADAQVSIALARFPSSKAEAYIPPANKTASALVRLITAEGREVTVGLNPYTGAFLGKMDHQERPLKLIRELHGKLLFGKIGQAIQELAASWTMVLILTGLYLWWPSGKNTLWGTFLPRFQSSGRVFWRDLHSVTGFWISGLLIFLIITGLPWSVVSGNLIHDLASRIGKGSPTTGLGWDGGGSRFVKSHPIEQAWTTTHAQQLAGTIASSPTFHGNTSPLRLAQVLQITQKLPEIELPYEIRMPVDTHGVYSIVIHHDDKPEAAAYIHLDQYTGKVIKEIRWKDFGPLAKAIAIGVSLHEGQYFGLPNQLLGLTACLGLIVMIAAGAIMWWKR